MAGEIVDPEGRSFAIDVQVPAAGATRAPRLMRGRLVTSDALLRTAGEKADLRSVSSADVVDMESSAVAALCSERAVRFLSVRVVSDEAGVDLPREVATLMNRSGSYLLGAAMRAVWNRPSSLKDLLALHNHANEAADRLADVTLAAVARLPD